MFLYSHWCSLPLATRHKIAEKFNIIKKRPTHVVNDYVQEDGYIVKDIEEALNVDAIQKFLNSQETDMAILWDNLIAKIEGREIIEIFPLEVLPPKEALKAKNAYTKNAKKSK